MNKVVLSGRLTKDPEVRVTPVGTAVGRYSLAVQSGYGDKQTTSFFDCVTFGKTAQFAENYLKKGMKIIIEGQLQQRSYQNREGKTVSAVEILVNEHEFAESRQTNAEPSPQKRKPAPEFVPIPDGVDDDELPFA